MSEKIYKQYKGLIDPIFSMTGMPPRGKEFLISVFATIRKNALADAKKAVARLHIYGEAYQDREHNIIDMAIAAIAALEEK